MILAAEINVNTLNTKMTKKSRVAVRKDVPKIAPFRCESRRVFCGLWMIGVVSKPICRLGLKQSEEWLN